MAHSPQLTVDKGRYNKVPISLGYSVLGETLTSQLRDGPRKTATLIKDVPIEFDTDGSDGEIYAIIDDETRTITQSKGYMDIKRITSGKPVPVWTKPLEVIFEETVTE